MNNFIRVWPDCCAFIANKLLARRKPKTVKIRYSATEKPQRLML